MISPMTKMGSLHTEIDMTWAANHACIDCFNAVTCLPCSLLSRLQQVIFVWDNAAITNAHISVHTDQAQLEQA